MNSLKISRMVEKLRAQQLNEKENKKREKEATTKKLQHKKLYEMCVHMSEFIAMLKGMKRKLFKWLMNKREDF